MAALIQSYLGVLDLVDLDGGQAGDPLADVWETPAPADLTNQVTGLQDIPTDALPVWIRVELDSDASGNALIALRTLENGDPLTAHQRIFPGSSLTITTAGLKGWDGTWSIHKDDAADTGLIVVGYGR